MIDTQNKQKSIQIGHRVLCQDNVGTVKYIGELEGHKGIWLGLDWDDPTRGRHDGSVNGKYYFTARESTSGSFVHPEKVTTGISVIESITSRYGHQEDEEEMKLHQQQLASIEHSIKAPFLMLIGFDEITKKQSNYKALKILNVIMQNVSYLGDPNQLSLMCPNCIELDLSKNLIHSWEEVFVVVSELYHLEILNVSENCLVMPENLSSFNIPQLKTLVCGSMRLTWRDIENLSKVFPSLHTLIAPNNLITNIDLSSSLSNIKKLDLERNLISDWSEIMNLKNLTCLKVLNLGSLKLSHIQIDDGNCFPSLEHLNLKHNRLNDWKSISELNKLENLIMLGIAGNPIYASDIFEMINQIIIALIGRLKFLNNINIRGERKGAEIDYIKKFGLEWLNLKNDPKAREKFLDVHTRYVELIRKYGEVEEGELKVEAKTIKESLIELNLIYEGKEIKKKVPPTMQVQKLVTLCQRLFRLSNTPLLIYISQEHPNIQFDLDESREIGLYSVQTGDKIVVKC